MHYDLVNFLRAATKTVEAATHTLISVQKSADAATEALKALKPYLENHT